MPQGMKYATPTGIRGVSTREIYRQQKEDEELRELLESEKPHAGAKAFAKGVAAGMTAPLILQAVPMFAQASNQKSVDIKQAHLAHWLQKKGIPEKRAREAAASAYRFLNMFPVERDVEDILKKTTQSGWKVDSPDLPEMGTQTFRTKKELVESLKAHLKEMVKGKKKPKGWTPERGVRDLERAGEIKNVKATKALGPRASEMYPSRQQGEKIFTAARESFEAAGKKAPGLFDAIMKTAPTAFVHALPVAGTIGLLGGYYNYRRVKAQQERLRELRGRLGKRNPA